MAHTHFKSVLKIYKDAYSFAIILAFISFVPALNIMLYSGHGGIGWILLPLAFPVALIKLIFAYIRADANHKEFTVKLGLISIPIYILIAFGASYLGAYSIHWWSGLVVTPKQLFCLYLSPFGLVFLD